MRNAPLLLALSILTAAHASPALVQTAIRLPTPAYTFDHTRHYRLRSAA